MFQFLNNVTEGVAEELKVFVTVAIWIFESFIFLPIKIACQSWLATFFFSLMIKYKQIVNVYITEF